MTTQSRAFEPADMLRWQAVASIIRKDMQLAPYALTGAIWTFAVSALFHTQQEFHALMSSLGVSGLGLDPYLFALLGFGLPLALAVFVVLLAQTNVASDTRHDWLVRPVSPLELVAAKVAAIFGVIIAPLVAGSFIYMMVKAVPLEAAFVFFLPALASVQVLVLSWLVSTPFRALLALIGMVVLLTAAIVLAEVIKIGIGYAATGGRSDPTPFPNLDDSWGVSLVIGIGLYVVSGVTLWLLLARRKLVTARWLFVGYFAVSTFVQHVLFNPL